MARDAGPPPPRIDWTAQRVFLGRAVSVWQVNLAALLAVLFVAFVGLSFSAPFLPLLVCHLGVTEPRAVARWSGVLMGLGPLSAVVVSPLWGRLADRIGGRLLLLRTVFGFAALNALSAIATDASIQQRRHRRQDGTRMRFATSSRPPALCRSSWCCSWAPSPSGAISRSFPSL
jgi:MFS family permease